jgi:hypothetical protein
MNQFAENEAVGSFQPTNFFILETSTTPLTWSSSIDLQIASATVST